VVQDVTKSVDINIAEMNDSKGQKRFTVVPFYRREQ